MANDKRKPIRLSAHNQMPARLQASVDVAQTTTDNARHWQGADGLSADAVYSPGVRKTVRDRARYEMENNSYARGIVTNYVDDLIGRGPMLVFDCGSERINTKVEMAYLMWSKAIRMGRKLRTCEMAEIVDGEGLARIVINPKVRHFVKLDLDLFECDRLTNPYNFRQANDANWLLDGIELDAYGNPEWYKVLRQHPGGLYNLDYTADAYHDSVIIHQFTQNRAEQHRGLSRLAPALPLFNDLRRYTLSVIAAAETAADFAAVIKSMGMPDEIESLDPMDLIKIEKRMAMTLPQGWDITQLRAEHPTTTYAMFKREIVTEVCKCLGIPYVIGAGDASQHNFSSARLDQVGYNRRIDVDRQDNEEHQDKITEAFLENLQTQEGFRDIPTNYTMEWLWEERQSADPREAGANKIRLESKQMTYAEYWARKGKPWRTVVKQLERESKAFSDAGLSPDENLIEKDVDS